MRSRAGIPDVVCSERHRQFSRYLRTWHQAENGGGSHSNRLCSYAFHGKLDKTVISTADETMVITYSPLSYVKLALENRAEEDPELAVLVKALYRYYVAASEYFAGITDEIEPSEDESKPSIW